jgi:hypothetical protein
MSKRLNSTELDGLVSRVELSLLDMYWSLLAHSTSIFLILFRCTVVLLFYRSVMLLLLINLLVLLSSARYVLVV